MPKRVQIRPGFSKAPRPEDTRMYARLETFRKCFENCRPQGWTAGRQAETVQDFARSVGRMNGRNNTQSATTLFTLRDVQLKNSHHQESPATIQAPIRPA